MPAPHNDCSEQGSFMGRGEGLGAEQHPLTVTAQLPMHLQTVCGGGGRCNTTEG